MRSVSEPTYRNRVPSPGARGAGRQTVVSTPQSITSSRRGLLGSRSARYSDTQITAAAREITARVAVASGPPRSALATSPPCAVTTNGLRVAAAIRPVGTR